MDQNSQDSWAELQKNLGVEQSSAEAAEAPAEIPKPERDSPAREFHPDATAEPTRPDSGWDSLLGDFGIETPEPPAAKVSEPEPPAREPEPRSEPSEVTPQQGFGGFGSGLIDQQTEPQPLKKPERASESKSDGEELDIDWGTPSDSPPAASDQTEVDTEVQAKEEADATESVEASESEEDRPPKRRRSRRRGRGRGRGRSKEPLSEGGEESPTESIDSASRTVSADDDTDVERPEDAEPEEPTQVESSAPDSTSSPLTDKSGFTMKPQLSLPDWFPFAGRRSKTPPAGLEAEEPADQETQPKDAAFGAIGDDSDASDQSESETDTESGEGRPKRRRRRRGRRRGRSSEETSENTVSPEDETLLDDSVEGDSESSKSDADESGEERPRGRRRRRRRPRSKESQSKSESADVSSEGAAKADLSWNSDEQDDSDDDTDSEGTATGRRGRRSSRQIPSWSETIGYVVDANIAAKEERRRASPNGSRGGSGRGRSRGGRRRKTT